MALLRADTKGEFYSSKPVHPLGRSWCERLASARACIRTGRTQLDGTSLRTNVPKEGSHETICNDSPGGCDPGRWYGRRDGAARRRWRRRRPRRWRHGWWYERRMARRWRELERWWQLERRL